MIYDSRSYIHFIVASCMYSKRLPIYFILLIQDPFPPKPWTVPRDATKQGPSAMALESFFNDGPHNDCNEDCLHVNVYTKEV